MPSSTTGFKHYLYQSSNHKLGIQVLMFKQNVSSIRVIDIFNECINFFSNDFLKEKLSTTSDEVL